MGMCPGILYSLDPSDPRDVDTESLDISSAFLQGLRYDELAQQARKLGYEVKGQRKVYIDPPENVWRHFRQFQTYEGSTARLENCRLQTTTLRLATHSGYVWIC